MKKSLNILHLSAAKNWGGGENHLENLCLELNLIENSIKNVILCVKNGGLHKKLNKTDLLVKTAPMLIKLDLRYVSEILKVCKKHEIDIIHIHDSTALTMAVMATKLSKLPPFVLSKKTSFPIKDRPQTLYKYNHPQIKKILCVSERTRQITAESIENKSRLVTIYHGTRMRKTINHEINLRENLKIPKEKIVVGMIANHIRAKNLQNWLEMIDEIVNKRNDKRFHFIQIGNYTNRTPAYLEFIKEKKLEQQISFLGFTPDASGFIPQFDISLLSSQSEGIPQFIYESFYFKVSVISTNVGGIPEIIEDNVNGMLSNPFQPQRLADKLIALSQDKDLMEKFAELSHQKLIKNFTTSKMAEQTLAEYKKVLYGKN
ncbi:glycosyltransferase family 4 protein [Christiangramia sp. SM2212]|uniref:Glycosyltransferase family 4 protein n=1 Tax=Christiangramia sediminicola TaxID=3073267 RepID=A0ABU1ER00_9FLAO|nr:glycosyltransferase family 4 protein [Christiangramia sp. SM2212]MDR5590821.1 glycosyltransferase family 4 protein [Christiangramia sp. SM2212]